MFVDSEIVFVDQEIILELHTSKNGCHENRSILFPVQYRDICIVVQEQLHHILTPIGRNMMQCSVSFEVLGIHVCIVIQPDLPET